MAGNKTEESYFLRELYTLADGQATKVVRGEELVGRLRMDPDGETDKARFLGTARRIEEEGYVIAIQDRPRGARLLEPLVDARGHPGG